MGSFLHCHATMFEIQSDCAKLLGFLNTSHYATSILQKKKRARLKMKIFIHLFFVIIFFHISNQHLTITFPVLIILINPPPFISLFSHQPLFPQPSQIFPYPPTSNSNNPSHIAPHPSPPQVEIETFP